jgi:hypothetical protein
MTRTPLDERDSTCKVCMGMEPRTIDRLLLAGHGIRFVADRWGHTRQVVKRHRDRCLVGDRRKRVEADLVRMAGGGGS